MNVPSRLDIALGATGLEAGAKIVILSHMDIRNDIKNCHFGIFLSPGETGTGLDNILASSERLTKVMIIIKIGDKYYGKNYWY